MFASCDRLLKGFSKLFLFINHTCHLEFNAKSVRTETVFFFFFPKPIKVTPPLRSKHCSVLLRWFFFSLFCSSGLLSVRRLMMRMHCDISRNPVGISEMKAAAVLYIKRGEGRVFAVTFLAALSHASRSLMMSCCVPLSCLLSPER